MDMAIEHAMNKLHATTVMSERLPRTRSQHDCDSGLTLSSTEASVALLAPIFCRGTSSLSFPDFPFWQNTTVVSEMPKKAETAKPLESSSGPGRLV